jgi:hypothetical protein
MKTASTYVQQCLTEGRDELLEHGICYPEEFIAENNGFMHIPIFHGLLRRRSESMAPKFAKLNAQGHRIILLSCEHFHFLPPDALRRLRDMTGASDIQVVYTARRWSDRIGSLWNHSIFTGGRQSLPEFYLSLMAGETLNYYAKWMKELGVAPDLDYSQTWETIADIFGRDAITVFPYSAVMDRGEDVFEAFCRLILGVAAAPKTRLAGQRRWASMPTDTQEIVRVLNEMHLAATGEDGGVMSVKFMRNRKKLAIDRTTAAIAGETSRLTLDDRTTQFDAAFAAMQEYNDRVAGGGPIFERASKAVAYVRPGYMLQDGVREEIQEIYRRLSADG